MKNWVALKTRKGEVMAALLILIVVLLPLNSCQMIDNEPLFALEPLPYAEDALAPHMSAETIQYHYGKHYAGYVGTANRLVKRNRIKGKTPQDVIRQTYGNPAHAEVYNQVSQAWNHAFFWKSIQPDGGGRPKGDLAEKIGHDFGGFDNFNAEFTAAAGDQFGSGWVWLVLDNQKLKIMATSNADNPVAHGLSPLFVVDLWEHAYYLDYRNRRIEFVKAVLEHLANWEVVNARLEKHLSAERTTGHN